MTEPTHALPVDSVRALLPRWDPRREPAVPLAGGYSHRVHAIGDDHVLRMTPSTRAPRLRHEAVVLDALSNRPDLDPVRSVLPRVIGEIDGDSSGDPQWHGWRGILVNRFPGTNAFRAWLDAPAAVRRRWIYDAVTALRAVHGFGPPGTGRADHDARGSSSYVVGWYGTRIEDAGPDWRDAHRRYLSALRGLLSDRPHAETRALVEVSLAACADRLDAMVNAFGPRPGHGDLHLHNVIVSGQSVTGIIDWEWGGHTEPDADLAHLLRWSLFPAHPADEDLEDRVSARDFVDVAPAIWAAYPEVAALRDLEARLFTYLVEHDLHQLVAHPDSTQAVTRLEAWHGGACRELLPA